MRDTSDWQRLRRLPPSPASRCPFCDDERANAITVTCMVVYMRCCACAQVWTIAERRATPRPDDARRRFV